VTENLERKIHYSFKNKNLLLQALTHKSYHEGGSRNEEDNERLEFLGDAIISLIVTDHIFRKFRDLEEGSLAKLRAHLVSSDNLFRIARSIDLGEYIRLGKGEERHGGRDNRNIVSSGFEALAGAVYLDANFRIAAAVILPLFTVELERLVQRESRINDYKSELQELLQKHKNTRPSYRLLQEAGKPPRTQFAVAVCLDEVEIGRGRGHSRKEAEQEAARQALNNIGHLIDHERLSEAFFVTHESRE